MQYRSIIRILGLLVALFSSTMIPPALVSLIYKDGGGLPFILSFCFTLAGGSAEIQRLGIATQILGRSIPQHSPKKVTNNEWQMTNQQRVPTF